MILIFVLLFAQVMCGFYLRCQFIYGAYELNLVYFCAFWQPTLAIYVRFIHTLFAIFPPLYAFHLAFSLFSSVGQLFEKQLIEFLVHFWSLGLILNNPFYIKFLTSAKIHWTICFSSENMASNSFNLSKTSEEVAF